MADQQAICKATEVQNWKWNEYVERATNYLSNNQQPRIISETELKNAIAFVKNNQNKICETADGRAQAAFVMGYVSEAESIDTYIPATQVGAMVMRDYSAFRHLVPMAAESSFNGTVNRFANDVKDVTSYYFSDHRFLNGPTLEQETILQDILNKVRSAKQSGKKPVVVFDLDDSIFDPSLRELRLLNELVQANLGLLKEDEIARIRAIKKEELAYNVPLDLQVTFGITNKPFLDAWGPYFVSHFFTSDYCKEDPAYPGAVEYVKAVQKAGATIVYFTGRQETGTVHGTEAGMRAGTIEGLQRNGFPPPDEKNVHLIMKPDFKTNDMVYKGGTVARVKAMGTFVAAFDNEPAADKIYSEAGALVVVDVGMVQGNFYQGDFYDKDGKKNPIKTLQDIPFEPETVVRINDFRRFSPSATKVAALPEVGGGRGVVLSQ